MNKVALLAALFAIACGKKSDHAEAAGSGVDALAKVTELKDRVCACKDKDCATKVHDEYVAWGIELSKTGGSERPDEAMAKKMTEVATTYGDCFTKAMASAPVAPSPPLPAEAMQQAQPIPFSGTTGIPECDDYKAAVDKIVACDKMPAASRSVLKDALGQALLSIRSLPADGRKAAATACTMGLDAIKQAASAVGCQ
ncbi:MAG TPA: hypothetical protein VGM90_23815 [Kofleriaceae bacterium]|jgi:hypothetical protein